MNSFLTWGRQSIYATKPLGDNQKSTDYQFIYEKETNYNQLFGNNELTDNYETKSYQINNESFGRKQSYIGIYTVQNNEQ